MKTLKWSLLVMLVTSFGLSTMKLFTRLPQPLATDRNEATAVNERSQEAAPNEPVADQPAHLATVPAREPASVVPLTTNRMDPPSG